MPSYTVNTSAENATRIIEALDRRIEREEGETDRQLYIRWLEGVHTELVFGDERRQTQGTVAPDTDIAEVT